MTDRYAVVGNPVAHSQSPRIHRAFAEQTGEDIEYETIFAEEDEFESTVNQFFSRGGKGLNITLPFKLAAMRMCKHLSEHAALAGAVNTLSLDDQGELRGNNTDGVGLVHDLRHNLKVDLAGKKVLVLGAGGAARGIIKPLLECHPAEVIVSNRNPWKPEEIFEAMKSHGPVRPCTHMALKGDHVDIIINATSAGHQGVMPEIPDDILKTGGVCYDLQYGNAARSFSEWSHSHGADLFSDGLGMLVEQAAESFYIWRGIRPETQQLISQLR